jgi:hypothetical protein
MTDKLFDIPSESSEQQMFNALVAEINSSITFIVQAAFNVDACFTGDDWHFWAENIEGDVYEITEKSDVDVALKLNRNFHFSTQQIFGFQFNSSLHATKFMHSDSCAQIYLFPSTISGPAIASKLFSDRKVKCHFETLFIESELSEIEDKMVHAEILLFDETIEDLRQIKCTINVVKDEIEQIELLCKLSDNYHPYSDYVKNWERDNVNV